jgi:hypothetical protein
MTWPQMQKHKKYEKEKWSSMTPPKDSNSKSTDSNKSEEDEIPGKEWL